MKKQQLKSWAYVLSFAAVFTACKDDKPVEKTVENTYQDTTLINDTTYLVLNNTSIVLNEGNFGSSNGDMSIIQEFTKITVQDSIQIETDSTSIINNIYSAVNGSTAGDVFQSIAFAENKNYCVLNGDAKIEVLDQDYKNIETIASGDITYPRYALGVGNKVYLTNGSGAGTVVVIDANNDQVLNTIDVGISPQNLILDNGKLYVANSGGFATPGDTVNLPEGSLSIIDMNTNSVSSTIDLYPGTSDLVVDNSGTVWVLSSGTTVYNSDYTEVLKTTPAYLTKVSESGESTSYELDENTIGRPSEIELLNDEIVVYSGGNVHLLDQVGELKSTLVTGVFAYGFNVGPDNKLWLTDAKDFASNGNVLKYDETGNLLLTIPVGIIPNGVYFK